MLATACNKSTCGEDCDEEMESTSQPATQSTTQSTTSSQASTTSSVQASSVITTLICTTEGQSSCIVSGNFKAVGATNLVAENVKAGVSLGGVLGAYPSVSYPLSGNGGVADLTLATFDSQIKSSTSFQFLSSSGTNYVTSGDADIDAANIKDGVSIFGTSGSVTTATQDPSQASIPPPCGTFTPCTRNATTCAASPGIVTSGGSVTTSGSHKILTFTTGSALTVSTAGEVHVLLVGGGGGGGGTCRASGGGGGLARGSGGSAAAGGSGVGGSGSLNSSTPTAGVANRGGGGSAEQGLAALCTGVDTGGAGGSGVVIIRHPQ